MSKVTRRGFLMGCSAAIAHMTGARLSYTAFGSQEQEPNQPILLTVFLRGGCDALSLLPPISGDDANYYHLARPDLSIPDSGVDAALPLNDKFGLHPAAVPLYDLYNAQKLAFVHAAGLKSDTRSHFDAMSYMELGTPGSKATTTGWLARHLRSLGADDGVVPALAADSLQPQSLQGFYDAIATQSASSFNLNVGYSYWRESHQASLRNLYSQSSSSMHLAGRQTLDAVQLFADQGVGNYVPVVDNYPNDSFSNKLKLIAQMIRLQVGLRAATIDLGGWDTHDGQANGGAPAAGYFASLVTSLAAGLAAFYNDLEAAGSEYTNRLTIVVMSEFGRRLRENNERGTDHGHGGMMMVLGGQVNGGHLYGPWPGLHTDQLYDRADLEVATDYRQVLSEILVRQMDNNKLGYIFPGYTSYAPLGIVQGADQPIDYSPSLNDVYLPMVIR